MLNCNIFNFFVAPFYDLDIMKFSKLGDKISTRLCNLQINSMMINTRSKPGVVLTVNGRDPGIAFTDAIYPCIFSFVLFF